MEVQTGDSLRNLNEGLRLPQALGMLVKNDDYRNEEVGRKVAGNGKDIASHEGKFLRRQSKPGDGYKRNVTDLYRKGLGTINEY